MADVLLNGREPLEWERSVMERGYADLLERDKEQIAGLLAGPRPEPDIASRPVTDIAWDFQ